MVDFNKAKKKPEQVEFIKVTKELKESLLEQCETVVDFCPASNHREEYKKMILGNGKIVFEPNDFNEYGDVMSVFDTDDMEWIEVSDGEYLVKRYNGSLTVLTETTFKRFYEEI